MSKPFARKILKKMEIPEEEISAFLEECEDLGGFCDCEILFNAEEKLCEKYKLDKFTLKVDLQVDEENHVFFAVCKQIKDKEGFPLVGAGKTEFLAVASLKKLLPKNSLIAVKV